VSRHLKPQKVGEVRHRNLPIVIDIMLDRNDLGFFFEVAGEKFKAESSEEVRKIARTKLDELAKVEWESVISIDHDKSDGQHYYNGGREVPKAPTRAGLKLGFERYERGKFEGKFRLKRKHAEDIDDYEAERRKFDMNHGGAWYSDNDIVIPYSKPAWDGLHAIVAGLHDLNDRLAELLGDEEKAPKLLAKLAASKNPLMLQASK
jgi:hypothetical protein